MRNYIRRDLRGFHYEIVSWIELAYDTVLSNGSVVMSLEVNLNLVQGYQLSAKHV
jgi:hypothetical protein